MERILIVRLGAMGDILHALPAVAALNATGKYWIDWAVEPRWAELLNSRDADLAGSTGSWNKPVIYRYYLFDTKKMRQKPFDADARRLLRQQRREHRQFGAELVIDLQGSLKSAAVARYMGARKIAGPAEPREALARFAYQQRVQTQSVHVIDQAFEIVQASVGEPLPPLPKEKNDCLPRMREDEDWADKIIGASRIAVLNPAAGWPAKQWPALRYGELAKRISVHGMRVLVNIGPGEAKIGAAVLESSGGKAETINCTVPQLIALTRRATLFVGGDTGPMHLAAMLGVPTVAIFGPTDPARNGPYYERTTVVRHPKSQTSYSHSAQSDAGIALISVDEVTHAMDRVLP